jgi:hypothetical protein
VCFRGSFKNVFVSTGTWPEGSTWARNPIPRVADDNKVRRVSPLVQHAASVALLKIGPTARRRRQQGLHDPASCPGPSGTSGPGCMQFPAVCPQDKGRLPWSTDGSGQGACSGDWTAGLIADRVKVSTERSRAPTLVPCRTICSEMTYPPGPDRRPRQDPCVAARRRLCPRLALGLRGDRSLGPGTHPLSLLSLSPLPPLSLSQTGEPRAGCAGGTRRRPRKSGSTAPT